MTRNQFLTDANAYLEAISPNYAKSTMDEKSRKLRYYARVFYTLHLDGRIRTNAPSKLTADDLHTYVTFRRSRGVKDSTIAKDLSIIGMFLRWKGNDAKEIYDVQYGNRKPHAYNGKLDPLSDDTRTTGSWTHCRTTSSKGCTPWRGRPTAGRSWRAAWPSSSDAPQG